MSIASLSNLSSALLPSKPPPPPHGLSVHSLQVNLPKISNSGRASLGANTVTDFPSPFPILPSLSITCDRTDTSPVVCPSPVHANTLYCKSGFNVQVDAEDNEPEDSVIDRFRRAVARAGIIRESRRRRFFETPQEKRKRKSKEAARKYRKRPLRPKPQAKQEPPKKMDQYSYEDDNWELPVESQEQNRDQNLIWTTALSDNDGFV